MTKRILAAVGMVGMAFSLKAQSTPNAVVDPSYSPHNYKHANKAALSRGTGHTVKVYDYKLQQKLFKLRKRLNDKAFSPFIQRIRLALVSFPGNTMVQHLSPLQAKNHYKGFKQ